MQLNPPSVANLRVSVLGLVQTFFPPYGEKASTVVAGEGTQSPSLPEIYYGRRYVFDPEKKTGDWTGDSITIPDVFPMTPVPLKGYSDPPEDVVQCDRDFTALLKTLDEAWMQGGEKGKEALQAAIEIMDSLGTHARMLLQKSLPRKGGSGIYGPQFRKV